MDAADRRAWMWAEAVDVLTRAERLHREMFQPQSPGAWEPPVDVIETEREVLILAALPGVDPDQINAVIHEDGTLIISGHRALPREFQTAAIHRLELPQGRFERRVPLPPGRYGAVRRGMNNGCLVVALMKVS